ncbi:MAG: 50S ribosomal protein L30 [Halodesulfurarchaeum sp.]
MQAVVQLRGEVNMNQAIRDTLEMLNLNGVNQCTLVPETETYGGMLTKVNDYVAFGEPSVDTLVTVISRRAEPLEGEADAASWIADHTEYDSVEAFAEALLAEETTLREAGLSPTLRLHPPRGGHDGIKNPATDGGQLGTHSTPEIDELLVAMR